MALVIRLLGGLTLWAVGFSVLYALHGYGCAASWGKTPVGPFTVLGLSLIGLWLVMLMAAGLFVFAVEQTPGRPDDMMTRLARIGAWGGLIGLLFMGAPVGLPAHCL